MIDINRLGFSYGADIVLKDITMRLEEGRIYGLLGENGVGKTTSIAKISAYLTRQGKKVLLAAGDTFRAAAREQLGIWADRVGVEMISQGDGADPAAVVFDAAAAAKK